MVNYRVLLRMAGIVVLSFVFLGAIPYNQNLPELWVGYIFLLQVIVTVFVVAHILLFRRPSYGAFMWKTLLLSTLFLVIFSFTVNAFGPRIATEADGPAALHYECWYGGGNPTKPLSNGWCISRMMPIGSSNIATLASSGLWPAGSPEAAVATFVAYEVFIVLTLGTAMIINKRL